MPTNDDHFGGTIKSHYMESTPWWPDRAEAPESAPNIVYILMDDTGYSDVGCYGSLIETPNIDQLAEKGLRYRDFHVNAMCSPTRASLMTGCNHHATGLGYLGNYDLGFPGYRGEVDKKCGFISEALVENGYNTIACGKWHLLNDDKATAAGPFDQWPLGRGFEKYYGFLGACTSQFYPALVRGNEYVEQPKTPEEGYHLSEDITDNAIRYIGDIKSNNPDKPFFCYLTYGAMHSPLQAPKDYIDQYKGKFDAGWDEYRKQVFEKQKQLGLLPESAELTTNDRFVQDWDSFSESEKKVLARYMEVYAGFMTHTDAQIGRLIDYLKRIGQYDNTMIVFLADNGASAEGTPWGLKNTMYHFITEKFPDAVKEEELEDLGSPNASCHYPIGWAHACNTPLQLYKSWSHNGGVKVPLIISYPDRIKDKGAIRSQYHHVTDIYRTVAELCGIKEPASIKGVPQMPKHGVSMVYSFDKPKAPTQKQTQYYELVGNRGIWHEGWKAVCDHVANPTFDFSKDEWELYHTDQDFCENHNLADKYPEKLKELQELWWHEAGKYNVLPMLESHMKKIEGFHSKAMYKFRPTRPMPKRIIYPEYSGGTGIRLPGASYSLSVFAKYKDGDQGVLVGGGDNQGGFGFYIQDRRLKFHSNWLDLAHVTGSTDKDLPEGDLELTFQYTSPPGKDPEARLMVNGKVWKVVSFDGKAINSAGVNIGSFPYTAVTPNLKDKGRYPYTNDIDRVELSTAPFTDADKNQLMENELHLE